MSSLAADSREPSGSAGLAQRLLRPFADVRPGEAPTVFLMLADLFLILVGYYILKTVREPLILASGGAEIKSYAAAGQALLLMGFVPLYGWFAARVDRLKLVLGVTLFFIANIELLHLAAVARLPYVGVVFFIWLGIYNLAVVAQFWSFANDLYRRETGERLFPLIAMGATLGSPVGAKIAERLFEAGVSAHAMLHITAVLLLFHLVLPWLIHRRQQGHPGQAELSATPISSRKGGFGLVLGSRYLLPYAVLLILLNLANTTGEYILGRSVVAAADAAGAAQAGLDRAAFIGSFYGRYFFYVNVAAVLIQAFLVSRIVRRFGLAGVLLALPMVALGSYSSVLAGAGLAVLFWAKIAENSTDYSVMNTARQLLWLPTSREEKYNAKQAVDTFFVRAGDVLSAGFVFAGTAWLGLGVKGFAAANLITVVVWLAVARRVLREHRMLTGPKTEPPPVPA